MKFDHHQYIVILLTVTIIFICTGPDAVKYVVNHADVQTIFCVPQTLNTVSLSCSSIAVYGTTKHRL